MQVGADALRAVLWSTAEDSTLFNINLPLDPTRPFLKALEEAVYATPMLLGDYAGVDVVVRTDAFITLPDEVDEANTRRAAEYCMVSGESDTTRSDNIPALGANVAWGLDTECANFLARTFRNPRLHCHMSPLLRFFGRKTMLGNSGKVYAHFDGNGPLRHVDIIAFGPDGQLAAAVSHPAPSDNDALYYIMAAVRYAGLDAHTDEILLCGDASSREAVMPLLRRYAACVMPVIFPSAALRAGKEAFKAPFPLVILPLCE